MKKIKLPSIFIYSLPVFIIFSIVLLAYWPGILVSDSMVQWNQTQTGVFDDWHPAYNTIYIFLLTKIWNNPGFVLLVQCLIMSLVVGYFFSKLEKYYNVNKYLLLLAAILFAIIPLNFNFAVTLLKDTLYSTFIIFLTSLVIDIINDKDFFNKKSKCMFLLFVCLITSLFRHNGVIVVILMAIILMWIYRKEKMVHIIFISWLLIYLLMTTVGFKLLNIQENSYANKYGPISHIIARMLNTESVEFSEGELEFLSNYVDIEKLKTTYNPYNMDYSINSQNIESLKESGNEYLRFGVKKILENPLIAVKHYVHLTSFLYSPVAFEGSYTVGMFIETDLWVYEDQYPNLDENSKIPNLLQLLKKVETAYQSNGIEQLTMRPALYMYLSIIMISIIAIIKKNKRIILILFPTIFNTISLAPAIPVAMTRYVYATMFAFWCFAVWFVYEIYRIIREKIKLCR